MVAATRVIATQGLSASTATIAKEACVSHGSLFLSFRTKSILQNELYIALKREMAAAAMAGLSADGPLRDEVRQMLTQWLQWATSNPEKRRALARLEVAESICAETHERARQSQRTMAELLERARSGGPLQNASPEFVLVLTTAIADGTMDMVLRGSAGLDEAGAVAFEAIWRVLTGPEGRGKDRTEGNVSESSDLLSHAQQRPCTEGAT